MLRVNHIWRSQFYRCEHTAVRSSRLDSLSVSQLKDALAVLGVPCAGATEKAELVRLLESARSQSATKSFVATDVWQRVPDGAVLEPGLEVRLDLAGGSARFARRAAIAAVAPPPPFPPSRPAARAASNIGLAAAAAAPSSAAMPEAGRSTKALADDEQADGAPIEWGCRVQVRGDVEAVRRSMRRLWEQEMADFCGQVGVVTHIGSDDRVTVEFEHDGSWVSWTFTASVLSRLDGKAPLGH